jgi:hypothetical protein
MVIRNRSGMIGRSSGRSHLLSVEVVILKAGNLFQGPQCKLV